jgi:hypothetical protein
MATKPSLTDTINGLLEPPDDVTGGGGEPLEAEALPPPLLDANWLPLTPETAASTDADPPEYADTSTFPTLPRSMAAAEPTPNISRAAELGTINTFSIDTS